MVYHGKAAQCYGANVDMKSYHPSEDTSNKLVLNIPGIIDLIDQFDVLETSGYVTGSVSDQLSYIYAQNNITTQEENRVQALSRSLYRSLAKRPMRFPDSFFLSTTILTDAVKQAVIELSDESVKQQTTRILSVLDDNIRMFATNRVPPVFVTELNDQSVYIEWVAQPFRMTFNIEKDGKESGYVLISDEIAGEVRNLGHFNGLDLDTLLKSLLILVFGNLKANYA
jgi:hypothetical protein